MFMAVAVGGDGGDGGDDGDGGRWWLMMAD